MEQLKSVDDVLMLLGRGADVYDEPDVDALAHALQCGEILRAEHARDDELVVAGLVHDIADIARPGDHRGHDRVGAALVRDLLGTRVATLVGAHVAAKRFLVATDPAYRASLSPRSIETLAAQGDELPPGERRRLAADPDLPAILALRRADERAKVPGAPTAQLDTWRTVLDRVAANVAVR